MKFELEPDNRHCADDVLLGDLQSVASRLGTRSLTKEQYNAGGRFSAATMQKRFGSWNEALTRSGLEVRKRMAIPRQELLSDLKRVAAELGTDVLSVGTYRRIGHFSSATISKAFGTWAKALEASGLNVSEQWHPRAPDDELLSNLASVWETLGRQPKKDELQPPLSRFSGHSYVRRYGSWRRALEAFVAAAGETASVADADADTERPTVAAERSKPQRAPRDPSWRLRFLVNRRDRFCCRACGRSPANAPGVVLHVDHIVPWAKGGETTMANLQTLCERCNVGKSDLAMNANEG
jgi:5-methylcytosine-specific restriction endonuclease McrA